ncbi:hypothetical protein TRFO_20963 [Tritrichomonas foetus]|uniref:Shwachman-Bodian-Diamond syndrome protein n=1 Tax=Tritrichomonas foetus TaxID=1144522 RepID=A0A1J4KEW3_9EUKA|nr:hypothetical protein TRFO_20963 [Tritrichomonas foetus]|eukprot:OHT09975.1 hypothetical protein TRFO_20963 [Tritrichomonas foetus]
MSQAQFQIVKLQKNNVKIEVIAKPGFVTKFREGKCSLNDAVVDDRIYSNSSKGEVAPEADIKSFGCCAHELLELVMKTGQYQLTAQEKRDLVEKRRLEVVNFIHENFIDSTSGKPHPVTRIENAIAQIKINIDPAQDAEHIARAMIPKLQTIIRLQESTIEGTVVVPNSKLGQVIGICYNLGTVTREEYGQEKAYIEMKISPGKYDPLVDQISKMSNGEAVFQIKGAAATCEATEEVEKTRVRKKEGKGGKKRK